MLRFWRRSCELPRPHVRGRLVRYHRRPCVYAQGKLTIPASLRRRRYRRFQQDDLHAPAGDRSRRSPTSAPRRTGAGSRSRASSSSPSSSSPFCISRSRSGSDRAGDPLRVSADADRVAARAHASSPHRRDRPLARPDRDGTRLRRLVALPAVQRRRQRVRRRGHERQDRTEAAFPETRPGRHVRAGREDAAARHRRHRRQAGEGRPQSARHPRPEGLRQPIQDARADGRARRRRVPRRGAGLFPAAGSRADARQDAAAGRPRASHRHHAGHRRDVGSHQPLPADHRAAQRRLRRSRSASDCFF